MKKLFDITFSFLLTLIFLPLLSAALIVVTIILFDFPLIRQRRRISLDKSGGEGVNIYKIRTIRRCNGFNELEGRSKGVFENTEYKKYIPPFCRWLRKSGIDEIPQLINVMKGEMSLVGPRPLTEKDLKILKRENPKLYNERCKIKSLPGITGYWQVYGNRPEGLENLISCDMFYEKNKSLILDVRIIVKTVFILLTAAHSDAVLAGKSKLQIVMVRTT